MNSSFQAVLAGAEGSWLLCLKSEGFINQCGRCWGNTTYHRHHHKTVKSGVVVSAFRSPVDREKSLENS